MGLQSTAVWQMMLHECLSLSLHFPAFSTSFIKFVFLCSVVCLLFTIIGLEELVLSSNEKAVVRTKSLEMLDMECVGATETTGQVRLN